MFNKIFKDSSTSRFLPFMSGLMIFLAVLSLAVVISINQGLSSWQHVLKNSFTVQVMPIFTKGESSSQQEVDDRARKLAEFLQKNPKIRQAKILSPDNVQEMLRPWIGKNFNVKYVVMPRLIEVDLLNSMDDNSYYKLLNSLKKNDSDIKVRKHEDWMKKSVSLARLFRNLAFLILSVVFVVIFGAIIYATKTGLAVHYKIIDILHTMGAKDSDVARLFLFRNAYLSLIGGVIGYVCAVPILLFLMRMTGASQSGFVSLINLSSSHFGVLFLLPVFGVIISAFTSFVTVRRTLEERV